MTFPTHTRNILVIIAFCLATTCPSGAQTRKIAITVDDLPFVQEQSLKQTEQATAKLLKTFHDNNITATGFVNEINLYELDHIDERVALLEQWLKNGHPLGNHTFSHLSFNQASLESFTADFLKGEIITLKLLARYHQPSRYFRFPYLQAGPDSLRKIGFETFLAKQNYKDGPVTIDNSDYIFNRIYADAAAKGDKQAMKTTAEAYIRFTEAMFNYYEQLTDAVFHRPIAQIFLCHANQINADNFQALADLMKKRNYTFITLDQALTDSVYAKPATYIGKGGFSWLHRWRMEAKVKVNLAEPEVPQDIMNAYQAFQR